MTPDYEHILFQLVSALKAKPAYLQTIDAKSEHYDEKFYEGMATAYHIMLDEVKNLLTEYDLPLENVGLQDYDPNEILKFKPLNYHTKHS